MLKPAKGNAPGRTVVVNFQSTPGTVRYTVPAGRTLEAFFIQNASNAVCKIDGAAFDIGGTAAMSPVLSFGEGTVFSDDNGGGQMVGYES
jgi:hypothetical protein